VVNGAEEGRTEGTEVMRGSGGGWLSGQLLDAHRCCKPVARIELEVVNGAEEGRTEGTEVMKGTGDWLSRNFWICIVGGREEMTETLLGR
jgi:hypothetical protein